MSSRRRRRVSPDRDVCDHPRTQLVDRFIEQGGLCYYCLRPCHLEPDEKPLMATREHLVRWVYGGRDNNRNVVMACYQCSTERGERDVLVHVKAVRQKYLPRDMVFTFDGDASSLPADLRARSGAMPIAPPKCRTCGVAEWRHVCRRKSPVQNRIKKIEGRTSTKKDVRASKGASDGKSPGGA